MTRNELSVIMVKIAKYYPRFYAEQTPEQVTENWYPYLKDNDFVSVNRAVDACICTMKYPPTIADIKAQIVEAYQQDRPTALQAFQAISSAVKKARDRRTSAEAYNALPPILRKLVGDPVILYDWGQMSSEAFHTVIMSAIRESYTELIKRESKYYAFPAELQKVQSWRIDAPDQAALPEPEVTKTIDEIVAEANEKASEHGMTMTPELQQKHSSRVGAFLTPMTAEEKKIVEMRENRKAEWSLK